MRHATLPVVRMLLRLRGHSALADGSQSDDSGNLGSVEQLGNHDSGNLGSGNRGCGNMA